ncbi:MAG: fluoride efflux transporter FluC [Mycetocola sp.]
MTTRRLTRVGDGALVLLGGMLGTLAREALVLSFPRMADVGVALIGINILGSALLGFLIGITPESWSRLRLALGTGLIGGFTSYSAFALDLGHLLSDGRWVAAIVVLTTSIGGGLLAAWAGLSIGSRFGAGRRAGVDSDADGVVTAKARVTGEGTAEEHTERPTEPGNGNRTTGESA